MTRTQDQIRGALLGAAAGDALGYCVQELTLVEIHERFGPEGIRGYDMENGYALISANTQLALFSANGVLNWHTIEVMQGVSAPFFACLRACYRDWLNTQTYSGKRKPGKHSSWLCCVDDLYARRTPDRDTVLALQREYAGTMDNPINRSKSPSCLPRVVPIGLRLRNEQRHYSASLLCTEAAAMTCGDPFGFIPAAYLSELLSRLLAKRPDSFRTILHEVMPSVDGVFGRDYSAAVRQTNALLTRAEEMAADDTISPEDAMAELNPTESHRVLAAACYTCLKFPGDFERAMVAAVNHSGDSATTGFIAGALMGVAVGTEGIPEFYLEPLELREILEEMADDLYQGCPMSKESRLFDNRWNDKYVQCVY